MSRVPHPSICPQATALALLLLLPAACEPPPPAVSCAPASSDSFMPALGRDGKGKPVGALHWSYRVNAGKPVVVPGATTLSFTFGDQDVVVDQGGRHRSARVTASFTATQGKNSASGVQVATLEDTLALGPPAAVIQRSEQVDVTISGAASGHELRALTMKADMPVLEFADRGDLDQLPVGHTEEMNVTFELSGSTATEMGGKRETKPLTGQAQATFFWRIEEQLATFAVGGKLYKNVVKLEEDHQMTSTSAVPGSSGSTTSHFWVARGIGIVRSEETLDVNGVSASYFEELADTNLEQP